MPSIEVLIYDNNGLTSDGLQQLFSLQSLKTLKVLSVKGNYITRVDGPFDDFRSASYTE